MLLAQLVAYIDAAMADALYEAIVKTIQKIPRGRVATYGQIAALAGNPRAARQVVRALHASSGSRKLPWHRVINAAGRISLAEGRGYELQRALLEDEGVEFGLSGKISLTRFGWRPRGS